MTPTPDYAIDLLATIVDGSDDAIISKTLDGIITSWNAGAERLFGYTAQEAVGQHISLIIPLSLRAEEAAIVERVHRGERIEHFDTVRVDKDGKTHDISLTISPLRDSAGNIIGASKIARDITERKEIEQERLELSGRLIKAQEEERRRLARELHDDFSQRLALEAVALQTILDAIGNSQPNVSERLREVLKGVRELGSDLHSLSHDLHSSKLEILGLAQSVSSLCREFSRQHKMQIDFDEAALPEPIPSETALCLFRVVQEGIQNANKHGRASRVEVRLTGCPTGITLRLSDNGVGFDLSQDYASDGIGILSMKERARMLYGTFEIRSEPMKGTQITLNIPVRRPTRQPDKPNIERYVKHG